MLGNKHFGTKVAPTLGMMWEARSKTMLCAAPESTIVPLVFISQALLTAAVALSLLACDMVEGSKVLEGKNEIAVVDVDTVREQPAKYLGKSVTVMGEVGEVHNQRALVLEDLDLIFEDELLVVSKSDMAWTRREPQAARGPQSDDALRIEGVVRKLGDPELARDAYALALTPLVRELWQGKPVLVAEDIVVLYDYAHWSEREETKTLTNIADYVAWPSASDYVGEAVDFQAVEVRRVTDEAIWVGPSDPGVKVVPRDRQLLESVKQGDRIDVQGFVESTKKVEPTRNGASPSTFVRASELSKSQS